MKPRRLSRIISVSHMWDKLSQLGVKCHGRPLLVPRTLRRRAQVSDNCRWGGGLNQFPSGGQLPAIDILVIEP